MGHCFHACVEVSCFVVHNLKCLLYESQPADPLAYTVAAAVLLAIGALASAAPAWKASAGDAVAALRTE